MNYHNFDQRSTLPPPSLNVLDSHFSPIVFFSSSSIEEESNQVE